MIFNLELYAEWNQKILRGFKWLPCFIESASFRDDIECHSDNQGGTRTIDDPNSVRLVTDTNTTAPWHVSLSAGFFQESINPPESSPPPRELRHQHDEL